MLPVWPGGQAKVLVSAGLGSHFWQVPPIQEVQPSGAVAQNSLDEQETLHAGGGVGDGGVGLILQTKSMPSLRPSMFPGLSDLPLQLPLATEAENCCQLVIQENSGYWLPKEKLPLLSVVVLRLEGGTGVL